eukprot:TRINITY_DN52386_c0_g1_i1.p1 TRINITY_DN52386_c0_g1~~TRINITY_DN52386_c0_g1_i1.p1  ORF type:complete len:147 (+),score=31.96 TRINITY_DN52386_c0_g1_i1:55-441(+)
MVKRKADPVAAKSPPSSVKLAKGKAGSGRDAMEARWYALMRQELPAAARAEGGWPVRVDHCFMRIALDNFFGKCWYDVLDKQKGAVKSMSDAQLAGAVKVAERLLSGGKAVVVELNRKSLQFRGKLKH